MSEKRYCSTCRAEVVCAEQRVEIAGAGKSKLRLTCPRCGKLFGTIYDDQLELRPVANAKISRG